MVGFTAGPAAGRLLDRLLRWGTPALLAAALGFAVWLLVDSLSRPRTLAGPGLIEERRDLGGPFRLTDQHGRTVTEADFSDGLTLLYFGYSFCPDLCPTALQSMADARAELAEPWHVRPVFVSLDPARDTPARLADYLAAFGPDFVGLSGPKAELDRLTRRFGVVYQLRTDIDPEYYPVDHSSRLYLMDGNWRAVAVLDDDADPAELAAALRRALAESGDAGQPGSGGQVRRAARPTGAVQ